jgi:HlyD family secretion protein
MKHWIRNLLIVVAAVALLAGGTKWYQSRNASSGGGFRTAQVQRGDVVATITATGTVQAEDVIDVGAQVAGRIMEFGNDTSGKPVDFGSAVKAGQVLAKIDPVLFAADVASQEAQLAAAKAGVDRAVADLEQLKAKYRQAERDWARAQKLGPSDALAQVEYDTYQSNYETAKANIAVGEAAIEQARKQVNQVEATLGRAKQNLSYTTISSPVDGVIIARRVNIGQTVVASLSAPSLFLLAKDLHRMEVWVAVNEADIGQIYPGQPVTFTVDTFPGETFRGHVNKIRLDAQMTQNVVTYTVEVSCDNSSGKLLPYLTANMQFETSRTEETLMVPNAALRYTPPQDKIAPGAKSESSSVAASGGAGGGAGGGTNDPSQPRRRRRGSTTAPTTTGAREVETRPGTLWVVEGEYAKPIQVTAGASDGRMTAVRGEGLNEGMEIIVGDQLAAAASASGTPNANPFIPQMPSRRGSGGGTGGPGGGGSRGGAGAGAGGGGGGGGR